jgi:putative toxin-antitoxin system antitoxin component (TIGR02293 family)
VSTTAARKGRRKPASLQRLFRHEAGNWQTVADCLQNGLGSEAVLELQRWLAISLKELAEVVGIPERTLLLRKRHRKMTPDESDRLYRVARIVFLTLNLFEGDAHLMRRWLKEPALALWNDIPLKLLHSEVGARAVENVIGRLEYGVYT